MSQLETTTEMLFVTDKEGRIVAAAFPAGEVGHTISAALVPLPGQQLNKVEVPARLATLKGHELQMILSQARIEPASSRLTLPEIKIVQRDH